MSALFRDVPEGQVMTETPDGCTCTEGSVGETYNNTIQADYVSGGFTGRYSAGPMVAQGDEPKRRFRIG